MSRRIFTFCLVFVILFVALVLSANARVFALTATPLPPSPTPSATATVNAAEFVASPMTSGSAPLTTQFINMGGGTNPIFACYWGFGDGTGQSFFGGTTSSPITICPSVFHTYTRAGSFSTSLVVTNLGFSTSQFIAPEQIQIAGPTATPGIPNNPVPDLQLNNVGYFFANPTCANNPKVSVLVSNIGGAITTPFAITFNGQTQTVDSIALAGQVTLYFSVGTGSNTAVVDPTNVIAESNETNNSLTATLPTPALAATCTPGGPTFTATASSTSTQTPIGPTPVFTRTLTKTPTHITQIPQGTRTFTRTPSPTVTKTKTPTHITQLPQGTRTFTRTPTPTQSSGSTCSPVSATIMAPFTFDGAGTFCWQSSNLGGYINSWNTTSVTINGVNATNLYVASSSYPAKIGGFWYVAYNSSVAWGHFEAK